jgi:hypothetical protein
LLLWGSFTVEPLGLDLVLLNNELETWLGLLSLIVINGSGVILLDTRADALAEKAAAGR